MLRGLIVLTGLLACACAPEPVQMSASEASERLERFAAGSSAVDVCTPDGRAVLRGAVRAYGAELARAGVAWPAFPDEDEQALRSVDAAVAVAFAAGFVEASDFQRQARAAVNHIFARWPQISDMRAAARLACGEVVELQRAASRLVLEIDRTQRLTARAERGRADPERLRRQRERLEHAQAQLEALAAAVQDEIAEARRRG